MRETDRLHLVRGGERVSIFEGDDLIHRSFECPVERGKSGGCQDDEGTTGRQDRAELFETGECHNGIAVLKKNNPKQTTNTNIKKLTRYAFLRNIFDINFKTIANKPNIKPTHKNFEKSFSFSSCFFLMLK